MKELDIQVGDRVTYLDGSIRIVTDKNIANTFFSSCNSVIEESEILKIERPKYEVIEEKKELLAEEEKEFLKNILKYYEIKYITFYRTDIGLKGKDEYIVAIIDYPENLEFKNLKKGRKYTLQELGLED